MILAIDTATRSVSLALHDGQQVRAELTWQTADHHTVELTPALHNLLRQAGAAPRDLTALAVTLGPGSYTGLRIGMSLAKGLALAASPPLPLFGAPTLDVVAVAQPHLAGQLCAVAQAGRGRVNAGFYRWSERGWQTAEPPFITTWEALRELLPGPTQVAGEIDERGREALSAPGCPAIVASAALGLRRLMQQLQLWLELFLHHFFDQRPSDLDVVPSSLDNHQCTHQYCLCHQTPKLKSRHCP